MHPVHWDHTDHARSSRYGKQDWDQSRLLQRIDEAETAILKRSRSLSKPLNNHGREQDAITRALHILSLLREAGQKQ
jgi:hypothetical protein